MREAARWSLLAAASWMLSCQAAYITGSDPVGGDPAWPYDQGSDVDDPYLGDGQDGGRGDEPGGDGPTTEDDRDDRDPACLPLQTETSSTAQRLVFLNRDGGTYYGSYETNDATTNESTIVTYDEATLPGWTHGDAAWDQFVACVGDLFADFDVLFTDVDPGDAQHIEVVVGGTVEQVGWTDAAGLAPLVDCSRPHNTLVMVFSGLYDQPDYESATDEDIALMNCSHAGQELGHIFGLDHANDCGDIMAISPECTWGDRLGERFLDDDLRCVAVDGATPIACACGGETQNSRRLLGDVLGQSDRTPPTLRVISPTFGDVVEANARLEIELDVQDDAMRSIELRHDGEALAFVFEAPWVVSFDLASVPLERDRIELRAEDEKGNVRIAWIELEVVEDGVRVAQLPCDDG